MELIFTVKPGFLAYVGQWAFSLVKFEPLYIAAVKVTRAMPDWKKEKKKIQPPTVRHIRANDHWIKDCHMTSTDTKVLEMSIEANIHIRAMICRVVAAALQLEGFIAMKKIK